MSVARWCQSRAGSLACLTQLLVGTHFHPSFSTHMWRQSLKAAPWDQAKGPTSSALPWWPAKPSLLESHKTGQEAQGPPLESRYLARTQIRPPSDLKT